MANFIRGNEKNLRAPDVLGEKLGSFFTKEDEERVARQWEIDNNRPLQRSWESDATFGERRKLFRRDSRKPKRISMDPGRAADELRRYERTYKGQKLTGDKETDKALRNAHSHMNDLRAAAGLDEYDYAEQEEKGISQELQERFERFQRYPQWQDREAFCKNTTDGELLRVIAVNDADDRVKIAAEDRLGELSIKV